MNVLIIDDQPDVVEGMLSGINWTELQIKNVYHAYDILRAKEIILKNIINIMLCDIEMPLGSGLDLYEWVAEFYPDIKCIFLTSHEDFSYAQKALRLGSFDYLIQPAPYTAIETAIKKASIQIKKEQKKEATPEEKTEPRHETELAKVEDATIKECETFLQNVLQAMHMEVELCSKVDEEGALSIEMKGDNMGILIGKRGQTLDSLQYLTNRVANKMQAGYVRVKLDTEDYRERRKETLENLARNIAHKVKRTRKPVTLEPMNPYERRIIHSALQGDKNVTTHSEGEEPYRRVVVTLVRK